MAPQDNDILLCFGLCVSWHLTVVHNYILAFILLIPHLKISSSCHCLKPPRNRFSEFKQTVSRALKSSFQLFHQPNQKEEICTDKNIENWTVFTTFTEKWYLLIYFPFKISFTFVLSFLIYYLSPKSWSRLLQQTPSRLFVLKNSNYRKIERTEQWNSIFSSRFNSC